MNKIILVSEDFENINKIKEYFIAFSETMGGDFSISVSNYSNKEWDCNKDTKIILIDLKDGARFGMRIAQKIRKVNMDVKIILFAENPKHAIEGYSVNAVAYWLYSIEFEFFVKELKRILLKLNY